MNKLTKKLLMGALIGLMGLLSACQGTSAATQQTVESAQVEAQTTEVSLAAEVATETATTATLDALQLLFGTLKLQGTDQAITAEQAAILLPLWTNYQTLTASMTPGQNPGGSADQAQATPSDPGQGDSALQQQISDLLTQIQSGMTADQISAIEALQITQDSVTTIMEELGITVADAAQGTDGAQPQGGGPGGGGGASPDGGGTPPEMNGTPPAGNGDAPAMQGTPSADGGGMRGGGMVNAEALTALIEYLTSLTTAQ